MDAMTGKQKETLSAAAIVESDPESLSEAPLLLEPRRPGENADCDSWGFQTVVEKEEDVSEGSFKAMVQPESVNESGPLPWLPVNNSISDELTKYPKTIDESRCSIWHTLSTWWKKDPREKHTINWTEIEIDACPPPDFVEERWQLSSPDLIEEPRQASSPENHEPELEAPPSPINDYSSSGWFTLPTWWRKKKRGKRSLTSADIDACPPPGCIEESGMFWLPEHESTLPTTEGLTALSNFKPVVDLAEMDHEQLGEQKKASFPPDVRPLDHNDDGDVL